MGLEMLNFRMFSKASIASGMPAGPCGSEASGGVDPPVQIRREEEAQRKCCRKTSVFLSREPRADR